MKNDDKQSEIIESMRNVECYPVALIKQDVNISNYTKVSLEKIASMGVAFEPLSSALQTIILGNKGKSGIYYVNTKGGHLANFKNKSSFMGTVLDDNTNKLLGQSELTPFIFNPTMLFMATTLISIDKKLDAIQELQKEVLEFLEQKEKTKLRGNLLFLEDIMRNYKYNWTNEMYKNSNHIKVLDIKQDSEQSILFYRMQIENKINQNNFFISDKDVKNKVIKIQTEFNEYRISLHLYAFSSFLEVLLLENFNSDYLNRVCNNIEKYSLHYRELYTTCYNQIEQQSKASAQSHLLKGLSNLNKMAGNTLSKIPVVRNSQIDETLINTSDKLSNFRKKQTVETMNSLTSNHNTNVHHFITMINTVNQLHNQSTDLFFDEENIYFESSENS